MRKLKLTMSFLIFSLLLLSPPLTFAGDSVSASSGSASESFAGALAAIGSVSSRLDFNQNFEGTVIRRELIQAPGIALPGIMQNFGPFIDKGWNTMTVGLGKTEFSLDEARALVGDGSGIKSHSKKLKGYTPTTKIVVIAKLPAKADILGYLITRGNNADNDSLQSFGRALLDAMSWGATHMYVHMNGATVDNKGSSFGLGINNGLSLIGGGAGRIADAISTGAGFTTAKVDQRFFPFIQGVAIRDGVIPSSGPIPPDIKISPQSKVFKLEKEFTSSQGL
ncbi:MAG: hypothetical protein A2174_01270 [Candidatus Portnoybacteria bacterium RBG_13_41_18]|uniref:Uncharacterized protein n=1 Tax=Candidatus Portnoybacteria bacterium RBG_13_41_18 TaxID=1801991 RepID=A0A1G2F6N6_9BACT|nr:MAG: hypothetical protein A2174_01270 [Candidatus Portnoybacteria bacterium RBG_13_41_18]